MYTVTLYHLHPEYRKGDLEEAETIVKSEVFKTKKEAKSWVLWQVNGRNYTEKWATGKNPSYVYWYTDKTWTNENSGESIRERFSYVITKK